MKPAVLRAKVYRKICQFFTPATSKYLASKGGEGHKKLTGCTQNLSIRALKTLVPTNAGCAGL